MTTKSLANMTFFRILIITLLLTGGCSAKLRTEYGQSRGKEGDESINGFGVLRRTYKNCGWSTSDVKRLNQRLDNTNALVWIPAARDTLHSNAIDWLEDWLTKDERTLIYLVPDGGCDSQYFEDARAYSKPEQRLEYRRRLARLLNDRLIERLGSDSIPGNGWFTLDHVAEGVLIDGDSGEWKLPHHAKDNVAKPLGTKDDFRIAYRVSPPINPVASPATAPPASASPAVPPPTLTYLAPQGSSTATIQHETLVEATDGSAIVTRITATEWGSSKIIVVGSASLVCNYSLSTPLGQEIAKKLIEETRDVPSVVGFMSTDIRGAQISDIDPEINAVTGMELFTVWPLSLVMLHLAVLGFIACMILLPIFGRPREGDSGTSSDFREHLDAVASLMHRSGGEDFARRRVSDYMRRIRGEAVGDWVIPDATSPATKEISIPSINPETTNKKEAP